MNDRTHTTDQSPTPVPSARHLAINLLHRCQASRHTLDHWLEQLATDIERLSSPEKAFFHALVYGVLRWQRRLDWIIAQIVDHPEKKIDPLVRIVLRLGLFQICFLDRVPASAAVNTAVNWVKTNHRSWATGFVNSILRRAANANQAIEDPPMEGRDAVDAIGIRHSFPSWMITRWIQRWGREETLSLCDTMNSVAPICMRTNTLKTSREKLKVAIDDNADKVTSTRYSPEGLCFVSPSVPIPQWNTFLAGHFQVQDEAAQLIGHLLSLEAGQKVWDTCAGRGTKTAHIAQLMRNQGHVLATDHRKNKLTQLKSEMRRLSIRIVQTQHLDIGQGGPARGQFDRILLDAPCSGLGVLRKNPDGKWRIQPKDLNSNAQRQLRFLESVIPYLAPDGIIVYAVCSVEPEETTNVIDRFLQKHQEFGIHSNRLDAIANAEHLVTAEGYLQTLPHRHQMDGFFATALTRRPAKRP